MLMVARAPNVIFLGLVLLAWTTNAAQGSGLEEPRSPAAACTGQGTLLATCTIQCPPPGLPVTVSGTSFIATGGALIVVNAACGPNTTSCGAYGGPIGVSATCQAVGVSGAEGEGQCFAVGLGEIIVACK